MSGFFLFKIGVEFQIKLVFLVFRNGKRAGFGFKIWRAEIVERGIKGIKTSLYFRIWMNKRNKVAYINKLAII
jgi:hypothetical protein